MLKSWIFHREEWMAPWPELVPFGEAVRGLRHGGVVAECVGHPQYIPVATNSLKTERAL